jgi:hypothetical protein
MVMPAAAASRARCVRLCCPMTAAADVSSGTVPHRRDQRPQVYVGCDQAGGAVVEGSQRSPVAHPMVAVDAPLSPADAWQQTDITRTGVRCGPHHHDHQGRSVHSPIGTGTARNPVPASAWCAMC